MTPPGRPPNPRSDRQLVLSAVIQTMRRARKPLSRKEIAKRVKARGITPKGNQTVERIITDGYARGAIINGHRIIRPARGLYTAERVYNKGEMR